MAYRADQEVQTISLDKCDYDKTRKTLSLASEFFGMPSRFKVRSHHTNQVIEFVTVGENDPLFDQDGWDGEQQIYRPTVPQKNVDHMTIYNC